MGPDPQHCLQLTLLLSSSPIIVMTRSGSVVSLDFWDSWMKDPLFSYWTRVPTNQERFSSVRTSQCPFFISVLYGAKNCQVFGYFLFFLFFCKSSAGKVLLLRSPLRYFKKSAGCSSTQHAALVNFTLQLSKLIIQ